MRCCTCVKKVERDKEKQNRQRKKVENRRRERTVTSPSAVIHHVTVSALACDRQGSCVCVTVSVRVTN